MPEFMLETGEVLMTLLQLLALIKEDTQVAFIDPRNTCDHFWGRAVWQSRVQIIKRYPPSEFSWFTQVQSMAREVNRTLAIVYMCGGASQEVSRTVKIVESLGGRAIVLACACNWKEVPEDVVAVRSFCHGADVFGVVLQCMAKEPKDRMDLNAAFSYVKR
jgi:hypothetical protein